jgi:hypothetical protein
MDPEKFGKDYVRSLRSVLPDREFPRYDKAWLAHWETTMMPHGWLILQKDESFFKEPRECIPGVNFSEFWGDLKDDQKLALWKNIQMSVVFGFADGDPMSKMDKLMDTVKSWWSSSGKESAEIDKILEDKSTPGQLKAILDAVLETRLVALLQEVVAELDLVELGIDPENPESLIECLSKPDSPLVQKLVGAVQKGLDSRIRSGKFKQEEIQRDVERIRALLQVSFGKFINEQMFGGGDGASVPAEVYMGNSPEARRQRMIARLQKKQRDKMSEGSNKR